jgi:aminopeptidase N
MRGAFFWRAVEERVGRTELDAALASFYAAHAGGAATMQQALDWIAGETGYDPAACAQSWLRAATIPVPGPCP